MEIKEYPFKLGIHPINWIGEDVAEHGENYTYSQVLEEIAQLGLKGTEMSRKFPTDQSTLQKELSKREIQLVTQWKSVQFSNPSIRKQQLQEYRTHVSFLKSMGCEVISTAEITGPLDTPPCRLTADEWKWLAEGLNQAGEIAQQAGMKLTYHHHGGTVIEKAEEIDRLMEMTDPHFVYLLYDTGHAFYGGINPLTLLQKHGERIAYVHLKDERPSILNEAREAGVDFVSCIRKGVFTVPGDGCIEFAPILEELMRIDYSGWMMIEGEQDPMIHNPYRFGKKAIQYLQSLVLEVVK